LGKGLSADLLSLTSPKRGHFRLESGHHSNLWLDLEGLFVQPALVRPFVTRLARALRPHKVAGVCGPLVGGAFLAQMLASALKAEFFFTERVLPGEGDGLYRVQYHLPPAARSRVRDKRLAIVDDAISAGSAVRATYAEVQGHGAEPVVIGALLVMGTAASAYFAERGVSIEAVTRVPFDLWVAAECPLCVSAEPLQDPR
jgi:orotate phosphoribosyltransferase